MRKRRMARSVHLNTIASSDYAGSAEQSIKSRFLLLNPLRVSQILDSPLNFFPDRVSGLSRARNAFGKTRDIVPRVKGGD